MKKKALIMVALTFVMAAILAAVPVVAQTTEAQKYKMTTPIPPHNAVWVFTGEEIDAFWKF